MKLIIGLGNPDKKYEETRHNAGFVMLDEIQEMLSFPQFQPNKKFDAQISEKTKNEEKILLAKPQLFMNHSGEVVKRILDFYKIKIEDLIVIHDDLDIELGTFKISNDSSAGGHNGVQNIIDTIGTQKFKRIRIGIEGAEKKKDRVMSGSDFVLQNFSKEELDIVKNFSKKIVKELF